MSAAVPRLRSSTRCQNSRESGPGKGATSFWDWCLKMAGSSFPTPRPTWAPGPTPRSAATLAKLPGRATLRVRCRHRLPGPGSPRPDTSGESRGGPIGPPQRTRGQAQPRPARRAQCPHPPGRSGPSSPCPFRRRSITVLNRSARCNRDARRVGLRCGASLPTQARNSGRAEHCR